MRDKGLLGLPGPVSCSRQGCLWGWGRLQGLCLHEVWQSPRPMAPQVLSLAVFSALPRLIKVQEIPLWVHVVYGFAFLFCCAPIWLESNSDLVELSATPLFSKNFHWHQEIFFLSCCHWTEADVIMLRTSEHCLPYVCVWGLLLWPWNWNRHRISQDICWNPVLYCLRSVTKSWVAAKLLDWHQRKKRIYWG